MTTWTLPRESAEWVGPITVSVNGIPLNTFQACVLPAGTRPTSGDWASPTQLGSQKGVMVGPDATPGVYRVWARIQNDPETPVVLVGTVVIT